jgi:L-cysteine S-thiosulfotransferase
MNEVHRYALALAMSAGLASAADGTRPLRVAADGIPDPLVAGGGDAARGRTLIVARESANCVLCHAVPDSAVRFYGDIGPSLAGIGTRLSVPQLRLRISDNLRLNPTTIMPSYYKIDGLDRVAGQYAGKPILSGQEVEDLVAYLASLK